MTTICPHAQTNRGFKFQPVLCTCKMNPPCFVWSSSLRKDNRALGLERRATSRNVLTSTRFVSSGCGNLGRIVYSHKQFGCPPCRGATTVLPGRELLRHRHNPSPRMQEVGVAIVLPALHLLHLSFRNENCSCRQEIRWPARRSGRVESIQQSPRPQPAFRR